jgi:hypothetical protein
MLTNCSTHLQFGDFISDSIPINNRTTQGDPSSMGYYSIYNAALMSITCRLNELSQEFVDDSMFLTIGDSLAKCHGKLKNMMEHPNSSFDWLGTHNSPYELSKASLMNFLKSYRDAIPKDLKLEKPNSQGIATISTVTTVTSYKYLGIIMDPSLKWTLQHTKVVTSVTFWALQVWPIAKASNGLSLKDIRQLYMMVAVPGFTYRAEVWYTGIHKPGNGGNTKGSMAITNKLCSIQRKVTKAITGALSSTTGNILDVHANILPIDILFHKVLFCATTHILSLPPEHPLDLLCSQIGC